MQFALEFRARVGRPQGHADSVRHPPCAENPVGGRQQALDTLRPDGRHFFVSNHDADGECADAIEKGPIDFFGFIEQPLNGLAPGRGTLCQRLRAATDDKRVLLRFLGDIQLKETLNVGQRQTYRQRRTQSIDGTAAESFEDPAVQCRENVCPVHVQCPPTLHRGLAPANGPSLNPAAV